MAIRVYPGYSPRIVIVRSPTEEATVQGLHSDIRDWEQEPANLSYPWISKVTGGEELDAVTNVGYTMELQNTIVGFEQRHVVLESGTVTTPDTGGVTLTDSTADFETAGVVPGDWIINFTDQSWCTVLNVESPTAITCFPLGGGSDNQWGNGDAYKVLNLAPCDLSGGNITARDSAGDSMSPILPTASVYLTRVSASSATANDLEAIQYSSYQNAVWVDVTSSNSGTEYPSGTREYPVNNVVDAVAIGDVRGFDVLQIIGNLTLTTGDDISEYTIKGQGRIRTVITIESAADVTNCEFKDAEITGVLDGGNSLEGCRISTLSYVNGYIQNCLLTQSTLTLGGDATILDCWSGVPGVSSPTINMGGSGNSLGVRGYCGGLTMQNKTGAESVSIDLVAGTVTLENTVTNGDIVVRGVGVLNDSSNGADIYVDGLISKETITEISWDTVWVDADNGTAGTAFPLGTRSSPVDNISDARTIAAARGINRLHVLGNLTLNTSVAGYVIMSDAHSTSAITLNNQDVEEACFHHVSLTGTQNGKIHCHSCHLSSIVGMEGEYIDCIIASNLDCKTGVWTYLWGGQATQATMFTIDMNGAAMVGITKTTLVCKVQNMTDAGSIFLKHGQGVTVGDSTNTAGTIKIGGEADWVDAGVGSSVSVQDDTTRATVWDQKISAHTEPGSTGANQQTGVTSLDP